MVFEKIFIHKMRCVDVCVCAEDGRHTHTRECLSFQTHTCTWSGVLEYITQYVRLLYSTSNYHAFLMPPHCTI